MTARNWQFSLLHLNLAIVLFAIAFAFVRAIMYGGLVNVPLIVWVCIGMVVGHIGAVALLALAEGSMRDPHNLVPTGVVVKLLIRWLGVVAATAGLMKLATGDDAFAVSSGLWFGTPLFWCMWGVYAVCKPYIGSSDSMQDCQVRSSLSGGPGDANDLVNS